MKKEKEITYIALYHFNDDNMCNLYCISLEELKKFIQKFIEYEWYESVSEFLEDYTIYKVSRIKDDKILSLLYEE